MRFTKRILACTKHVFGHLLFNRLGILKPDNKTIGGVRAPESNGGCQVYRCLRCNR
jgi:hypothetical protein